MNKPKSDVRIQCRFYQGNIPCIPHKTSGVHCEDCTQFDPIRERILIVKLGAAGDVIRTTPLLRRFKKDHPAAEITWLTYYPELLPSGWVDRALNFSLATVTWLKSQRFDWLINLDKDMEAIALAETIDAAKKTGFRMDARGRCRPIGAAAETNKWLTGLWDDLNKANDLSYLDEIFQICGYDFSGEEYLMDFDTAAGRGGKPLTVGLNTGCGGRWPTRLWPDESWIELANRLVANGYHVLFLGGPQEDEKNRKMAQLCSADYRGVLPLRDFCNLVHTCDFMVTQVTMAMHIAIAAKKYLVLLNNIFNRAEFFLYGRGAILEPELGCLGCFKQQYDDRCEATHCMSLIKAEAVQKAIENAPDPFSRKS
jgi:ADP-heptose:LPS heptosyltransferase